MTKIPLESHTAGRSVARSMLQISVGTAISAGVTKRCDLWLVEPGLENLLIQMQLHQCNYYRVTFRRVAEYSGSAAAELHPQ